MSRWGAGALLEGEKSIFPPKSTSQRCRNEATKEDRSGQSNEADERFVMLIAQHQLPLTAFLHTMLRSRSDAEDVLQETNLVLWRKRQEFDPERSFASWACRIAHLQALSFLKARGSRARVPLSDAVLDEIAARSSEMAEKADRRGEQLRRCLEKLSVSQQAMLRSRYQQEVSLTQLAESLGKTPRALSMSLYRLRSALKECVERAMRAEVSG